MIAFNKKQIKQNGNKSTTKRISVVKIKRANKPKTRIPRVLDYKPQKVNIAAAFQKGLKDPAKSFAMLASHPFDANNWGAICPDGSSDNATPYHYRTFATLSTGVDWTGAVKTLIVLPNPMLTLTTYKNPTLDDTINFSLNQGVNVVFPTATAAPYVIAAGLSSEISVYNSFSSYRVVSIGLRLRRLNPTSQQDVAYTVTQIPISGVCPPLKALTGNALSSGGALPTILTGNTPNVSQIALPDAKRFTGYDIMEDVAEIVLKPTDNRAFQWHSVMTSDANIFTNYTTGDYVMAGTASGLVDTSNATGSYENMEMRGWPAVFIGVNRGEASVAFAELELIYHFEVVPYSGASGALGIPSSDAQTGSANTLLRALDMISKNDDFKMISNLAINGVKKIVTNKMLSVAAGILV